MVRISAGVTSSVARDDCSSGAPGQTASGTFPRMVISTGNSLNPHDTGSEGGGDGSLVKPDEAA